MMKTKKIEEDFNVINDNKKGNNKKKAATTPSKTPKPKKVGPNGEDGKECLIF